MKRVCYDESIKIKILNIFSEKNRIRVERLRNFMEKTKELKSTKIINNYLISGQKKSYYEPHKNDIKRKSLACLFSHEKAVNIKLKNIKGKNSSELMKFNEKNKVASKYPAYLSSKHILITEEYKKKFANFKNKQENFEEKNPLNKTTNLDLKKKYI